MKPSAPSESVREPDEPPTVSLVYDGQENAPDHPPGPPRPPPRPKLASGRYAAALVIAGISDVLSVGFTMAPPLQLGLDLVTAAALFAVLGWRWMLLPALILEAIPGISALPMWVLVVSSIATWGTRRATPPQPVKR